MKHFSEVIRLGGTFAEHGIKSVKYGAMAPLRVGRFLLVAVMNEALQPPHVPDELREHFLERARKAQEDIRLAANFAVAEGVELGEARLAETLVHAEENAFVTPQTVQELAEGIKVEYFKPDENPYISDTVADDALRIVGTYQPGSSSKP